MNTFESDVAQLNTGDRIREANRQRLGPTEGGGDQQVSDLKRLCFRHWLYLMLASLLDAPDPETGIDQLGSTRMDVMRAALSCPGAWHATGFTRLRPPLGAWNTPRQTAGRTHRRRTSSSTNGQTAAGSCPFAGSSPESSPSLSVSRASPCSGTVPPSCPHPAASISPPLRLGTVCVTWLRPGSLLVRSSMSSIAHGRTRTRSTQPSRCAMGAIPAITRWKRSPGTVATSDSPHTWEPRPPERPSTCTSSLPPRRPGLSTMTRACCARSARRVTPPKDR